LAVEQREVQRLSSVEEETKNDEIKDLLTENSKQKLRLEWD